jgi:hypothetical protein
MKVPMAVARWRAWVAAVCLEGGPATQFCTNIEYVLVTTQDSAVRDKIKMKVAG